MSLPDLTIIIGAPRVGGTLYYQLMCQSHQYGYIPNIVAEYFPDNHTNAFRLLQDYGNEPVKLWSHYGRTAGPLQPSECNLLWRKWFGTSDADHADPITFLPGGDVKFQAFLRLARSELKKPLLMKSSWATFRMDAIRHALQDIGWRVKFIFIYRDVRDAAKSDLLARYVTRHNPNEWTGPKPPNYEHLRNQDLAMQVCEHQLAHYREAHENCTDSDEVISYEEICTMYGLQYQHHSWDIALRGIDKLRIDAYVKRHYERFKMLLPSHAIRA